MHVDFIGEKTNHGSFEIISAMSTQAFSKTVEQSQQMDTHKKISWENLPETHREAWTQHVINFYPPNTVSPEEAAELAREEYAEAATPLPVAEVCDAD
jgi:hypothetical protein